MPDAGYPHTVEFFRHELNEKRERRGDSPVTDREVANYLLAVKHWAAAEWLLGVMSDA